MSHNLEYLTTRPGIFKIFIVVFGIITIGFGLEAHYESAYTEALDEVKGNETLSIKYKDLPGTGLEIYFIVATLVCMVLSFFYLAAMALVYELEEMTINRYIDSAFHILSSVLLLVAGFVIIFSGATIENKGCYIFDEKNPTPFTLKSTPRGPLGDLFKDKNSECQLLKEKIVAGIFGLLNGVLYAVTAAVIFQTKHIEE